MKLSRTLQIDDHVFHISSSNEASVTNSVEIVNPRDMNVRSRHIMTPTENMLVRKIIQLLEQADE